MGCQIDIRTLTTLRCSIIVMGGELITSTGVVLVVLVVVFVVLLGVVFYVLVAVVARHYF